MFEESARTERSLLWKVLPVAVLAVAALVAGVLYLGRTSDQEEPALAGIVRAGNPDFEWYGKYIELVDPKIQMGLNFAGNRVVMFSGIIKNGGERTLDVVELKVVLFNYDEPVREELRTPIRPGPYTPPIPSMTERPFSFYIEKIPRDWKSSHAEMSISGFRFAGTAEE